MRRLTSFSCPPGLRCSHEWRTMSDDVGRCKADGERVTFYSDGTASAWCRECARELESDADWNAARAPFPPGSSSCVFCCSETDAHDGTCPRDDSGTVTK